VPDPFEDHHYVVVQHQPSLVLRETEAYDLLQLQLRVAARAVAPEQNAMRAQSLDRFLYLVRVRTGGGVN
jgi:hypothetical protein